MINIKIYDVTNILAKSKTKKYSTRTLSKIAEIIIHHSGTSSESPEAFAKYHVENNGWPGIGYHYVIDEAGKVYKTQAASTISYHTPNHNTKGIGVCLIGNFEETIPTQATISSLIELCRELIKAYGIKTILAHNETTKTLCPGKNLNVKQIRGELTIKG